MSYRFHNWRRQSACFALLAALVFVATCEQAAFAQETKAERPGRARGRRGEREVGFTPLFKSDGTEIWKAYGKEGWPEGWKLEEGVLHRHAAGGDLMTKQEYGDFDLRFAWKVSPGGNSGVMYRATESSEPAYMTGPEYQVLDDAKHKDGQKKLTSAGSLYALYPPTENVLKPAGEWNRSRIVVEGNHVQHFLNGTKVVDTEIGSDDWNQKLAASKFATWPKFGKNAKGHVVLQDHGDEVWYRNMRIKDSTGKPAGE
ncbi:3-keto-disaccharide hydrolase [Lacipirellula limnantheis]|uniref:3-keto-alpha-glucoside-1,2-lyase/3-keto-2-hydroxy-glucal hydratase domain-containing protein n=1 Tax=Lacipirellula limnantheis TaxID=2528024 RepID=A0A517TWK9_9BACT|nr:DUF1080 domain-containing protein [Lacipirellula limnantheis]QDT72757.1 hypothetical protein I41_19400 [Lacipirellula limnantheis]